MGLYCKQIIEGPVKDCIAMIGRSEASESPAVALTTRSRR